MFKEQHEGFAQFFSAPTREALRELLRRNLGETDYLDFKQAWPDTPKLVRHILALANSGGGATVVGVTQAADGKLLPTGLNALKDKVDLIPPVKAYVPKSLDVQVLDFHFDASEYAALVGKVFQVLLVESNAKELPYLASKDGEGIRANAIYVRSGTASAEANQTELHGVLNRRIESGYSNQSELDLQKHLAQLRTLDEARPLNDSWLNEMERERRGRYEDEESSDFKEFLEDIYEAKKAQILRILKI